MRYLKTLAGVGLAVSMAMASVAGAQAAPKSDSAGIKTLVDHYVLCAGYMVKDSEAHAKNCAPGQTLPLTTLAGPGGPAFEPVSSNGGGGGGDNNECDHPSWNWHDFGWDMPS